METPYEIVSADYEIAAFKLPRISALVDKLNKRCRRLNIPELTLKVTGTETRKINTNKQDLAGNWIYEDVIFDKITFTGGRPKLGGWEFAGTLEHDLETGLTILRTSEAFGRELPKKFRSAKPICEHCGLQRNRRDTYIVYSAEQDVYKQVGHQCVADFLGLQDVHKALDIAQMWYDLDSICGDSASEYQEGWGGFKKDTAMSLMEFLSRAVATVRIFGFVSHKAQQAAYEKIHNASDKDAQHMIVPETTKVRVMNYCFPEPKAMRDKWGCPTKFAEEVEQTKPTDADIAHAEELIAWAQTFDRDKCNDYQFNLLAATANEIMPFRRSGIVASLPAAWNKHQQIMDERQKKAAAWKAENAEKIANSKHIGAVGERLRGLVLTVKRVIPREHAYGVTYITALEDAEGHQFTWFASGHELTVDKTYTFDATVKDHGEFKGIKQTVLTRCTEVFPPHDWQPLMEGYTDGECAICGKQKHQHKAPKAPRKARKAKAAVTPQRMAENVDQSQPSAPATATANDDDLDNASAAYDHEAAIYGDA